jgi:hypothetical protein
LNVTGGGAVLAVEVGNGRDVGPAVDAGSGVAGDDGEGVGACMVGEGLETGATMEARGMDGAAVRSPAIEPDAGGVEIAEPAGEHAASASTRTGPISRVRPIIC